MRMITLAVMVAVLSALTACVSLGGATPTPATSALPAPSPTAEPTPTTTPEPTASPLPTAEPTPATTPEPMASPLPTVEPTPPLPPTPAPATTPTASPGPVPSPTPVPSPVPSATPPPDEHSNTADGATSISNNYPVSGWIYSVGDEDWFAFAAQEHATYRLEVSPGSQEPQVDPLLRLLGRDGAQTLIVDEDGGQGEMARIEWVAPVTATYYVSVAGGHTSATGTYSILLAEDSDDHANSADGATPIGAGASSSGRVEHVGDGDWFAFTAEAGATYRASVSPGTLGNPFLQLIGRDSQEMLRIDAAGGQGNAAHIEWTAPASGEYYLSVSAGLADATGSYTLTLEAEVDDHANSADGATGLATGGRATGTLETAWDHDWFRFTAKAGTEYTFNASGAPNGPRLQLVGADGATRLITEAPGPADPSRIEWTAPVDGTYYLAVRSAANSEPGNYAISVSSRADDYPDVPADAASLGVDTPILGTLETRGDEDWFSFTVSEGWLYRISLALGSLPDSTLTLLDQNGTSRIQVSADESPFIEWMAPISGTYYLRVRAPLGASTGSYTLSMSAEGDDYSDESPGAAEIRTDGYPVTGKIETAGDLDWFSFPVLPQTRYTITLVSDSLRTARMDLRGAVIVNGVARDGIGYASGTTHYADPGTPTGGDSVAFVGWSTFASGIHFIQVSSNDVAGVGTYRLSVVADGSSGLFTGVFETVATPGDSGGVIDSLPADEHPDTSTIATPLVMGDTAHAALQQAGDNDMFSFEAQAGWVYRFETTAVSLQDPDLTLYGPDGTSVVTSDYDSGEGKAARIEWTAPASDTYYVQVSSRAYSGNNRSGTYWLTASAEPADHGSTPEAATRVSLETAAASFTTTPGDLAARGDEDWYAFDAIEGWVYRLETRLGSLADSNLTLYGPDGEAVIKSDYDSGEGKASRIEWVAPASDTFYVKVGSRSYSGNPRVGSYALTVSSDPDDHSDTASGTTPVPVSTKVATSITIPGDLEVAGDNDMFSFEAQVGWGYRFETTAVALADPDLTLYGPGGTPLLDYDYDSGEGKAARLEWTAPASDTFYVKVGSRSYSGNIRVGTYTLTISGEPDDHGADHSAATEVLIGTNVASYATVSADLEVRGDEDWLSFDAVEGWIYRLQTGPGSLADPDLTLYGPDGTTWLSYDYDSGEGKASRIEWVARASGTYYVKVDSRLSSGNPGVGICMLTISGEPDDHSGSAAGATGITVGNSVSGALPAAGHLQVRGDEDWFAFWAVEGREYRLETSLESLADSSLTLYGADGSSRLTYDYDSGEGKASLIEWTAPATGKYYVSVSSRNYSGNPGVGGYAVVVTKMTPDAGDDETGTPLP